MITKADLVKFLIDNDDGSKGQIMADKEEKEERNEGLEIIESMEQMSDEGWAAMKKFSDEAVAKWAKKGALK